MDDRGLTDAVPRKAGRPRGPTRVELHLRVLITTEKRLRQSAFLAGVSLGEYLDRITATRRDPVESEQPQLGR